MTIRISLTTKRSESDSRSRNEVRLYLFRHGYTRYNLEKRYQGRSDLPLLKQEMERIQPYRFQDDSVPALSGPVRFGSEKSLSSVSENEQAVYVSPALRARQTAGLLFPGMKQIIVPKFQEMDFGIFEGRSADEMEDDSQYRSWVDSMCEAPVPGGESRAQFTERVAGCFEIIAKEELDKGQKRLIIVAHGGVQMAVMDRFGPKDRPYWAWQTEPAAAVEAVIS
ncbi:MAG: histidine phosphatase family protein [Lachnospiraceae bacterium]|nr:histidine phosphatase family protein [Lachnospiraceae bacterium]